VRGYNVNGFAKRCHKQAHEPLTLFA
jgi:hypothetical protein